MRQAWPLLLLAGCGSQDLAGQEPLRLTQASPPPAYLGEPYAYAFAAEGGVRPYTFSLDGPLPEGLTFQGGRLSGTPRAKGSFTLILTVEDGAKNSRSQRLTLQVTDPPPPRLTLLLPQAQVEGPFLLLARLEGREALGFSLDLPLGELTPDLSTFKALSPAYLLHHDGENRFLHLDMAFPRPLKGQEVFRLFLVAEKPLIPRLAPRVGFYDREGKPLGTLPPRQGGFQELLKIARGWGQEGKGLPGDLDGDGRVGEGDLLKLKEGYFKKEGLP